MKKLLCFLLCFVLGMSYCHTGVNALYEGELYNIALNKAFVINNDIATTSGYTNRNIECLTDGKHLNNDTSSTNFGWYIADAVSPSDYYVQVDLEKPVIISEVALYHSNITSTTNIHLNYLYIWASNDPNFEEYTVIKANTGAFNQKGVVKAAVLSEQRFRYVRIGSSQEKGATLNNQISEIEIFTPYEENIQVSAQYFADGVSVNSLKEDSIISAEVSVLNGTDTSKQITAMLVMMKDNKIVDIDAEYIPQNSTIPDMIPLALSTKTGMANEIDKYSVGVFVFDNFDTLNIIGQPIASLGAVSFEDYDESGFYFNNENSTLIAGLKIDDSGYNKLLMLITKPDEQGNATVVEYGDDNQTLLKKLLFIGSQFCPGNIENSAEISMGTDYVGGFYTMYTGITGLSDVSMKPEEQKIFISTETLNNSVLKLLRDSTSDDELGNYLDKYGKNGEMAVLDTDTGRSDYLRYKDIILKSLFEIKNSFNSVEDVNRSFDMVIALTVMNNETITSEKLDIYAESLSIKTNKFYTDDRKPSVVEYLQKVKESSIFTDTTSFQNCFDEALKVSVINSSDVDSLSDFVKYYVDLGLSYGDFSEYQVNKTLVNKTDYVSSKEFIKAFNARKTELENEKKNTIKPSLGGGSTGSASYGGNKKEDIPTSNEAIKPTEEKLPFDDISNYPWAYDGIKYLYSKGVNGKSNREFAPEDKLLREECVKMIVTALDIPFTDSTTGFSDVKNSEWYTDYINTAFANGIINGISDDSFGIGERISRQDFALIIYRAILDTNAFKSRFITERIFSDSKSISDYALGAVKALSDMGIISGYDDGCFYPHKEITRAEAAKVLYGAYRTIN